MGTKAMERLKTLVALIRVRHTGQVVGIVSVLSIKSNGISAQSFFAIASFLFLCIALFSFDDAHDHKSDLLVHPDRPIPRGVISSNQVYLIGALSFSLGIVFATGLALYQLFLFLISAVLGLLVIFLKLESVFRAILIGSMFFLLFPFGISPSPKSTLFGLIVALPHIAGTIAKDFLHLSGDSRIGLQSPPNWAKHVASFSFLLSGGIILLPIVMNLVNWFYIPFILPTLSSCLILSVKVMRTQYEKVYIYGGVGMISALVAFATNI